MPIIVLLLALLLAACTQQPHHPHLCNQGGILSPCSEQEFHDQQAIKKKNEQSRQHCREQGLDWAGGNQCCPTGTKQIGCVANLPCLCR